MEKFLTEIKGLNKSNFAGPEIEAVDWEEAEIIAGQSRIVVVGKEENER